MNTQSRSLHIMISVAIVALVALCDVFRPYGLQLSHFYVVAVLYLAWFVPGPAVWYFTVLVAGLAIAIPFFGGRDYSNRIDGTLIGSALAYVIWNRQRYARNLNSSNFVMSGQIDDQIAALQQLNTDLNKQIEERLQVEASLRDSEARYRTLIELSPDAIVVVQDGRLVFANEAAARIIRAHSADELLGRELIEMIAPEQRDIHIERQRALLTFGDVLPPQEYRVRRLDGTWAHVEVLAGTCRFQHQPAIQVVVRDLTSSKRLAIDLRKLSDFRERVIATAAEGVCVCSPLAEFPFIRFSIWNDRMIEITGYTLDEINQSGLIGLIHPKVNDPHAAKEFADHIWEHANFLAKEVSFTGKDRARRTISVSSSRIELDGGGIAAIALLQDITERKQAEEQLRESERRFRGLVEAIPDLIFRVDPHGTITYAKSEPADDLIMPASALVGKSYRDYMPTSIADRFDRAIARAVKTSCVQTLGYDVDLPDGRHQHFEARVVGFADGSSVVVARNDTEHLHAIESLQESELRFRQLAENIHEVFWIASPDNRQLFYVSPAYEELCGRPCEGLYADPMSWLELVHPDDREMVAGSLPQQAQDGYDREYRIIRPDGALRWVRDRTFPVLDEHGVVQRIVGLAEDITKRKQAEQELATSHARTTVLAQMTRELNNCTTPRAAAILILETARQLMSWDSGWIHLWNEQEQAFEGLAEFDLFDGECREVALPPDTRWTPSPMMRRVMHDGPQLVLRESDTDHVEGFRLLGNQRRSLSMMYVPIRHGDEFVGALSIQSYQKHAYDQVSLTLLQMLASHCAGALARIRTAEALREGEKRYHRLLEELPVGVFVHDGERFHYANPRAMQILGVSNMQELSRRSPLDCVAPEFRDMARQRIHAMLQADEILPQVEAVNLRNDGTRVDVEVNSRSTMFTGRKCVQVLFQDITARKRSESLLNGQMRVLKLVAIGAPLTESLNELTQVVEHHAPGLLCSILLLDGERLHLHHGAAPSLPPDYVAAIDGVAIGPSVGSCGTAAFRGESVFVEDIDADPLWHAYKHLALPHGLRACWSAPIFDARREVLGTFAMYYRHTALPTPEDRSLIDMATSTAAIAITRNQMEATLRESEDRLRTLLENLENVAVQAYEVDGTITFWNRASERLYGFSADEALGRDLVDLLHAESNRESERRLMKEIVRTGTVPEAEEVPVVSRDGRRLWVFASRVLHPRPGRPPEFCCFDVDITARKQAEEELATRQAELLHAARLSTVGQMVATLSHEVAQPLTAIGNFAAASAHILAADSPPSTEKLNEYVRAIAKQNERCSAILDRLRNFSRRAPLRRSSHVLNSILREAAELVAGDLRRDGIEIHFDFAENLPLVLVDKIQIQQVLVNLLTNARDALQQQPIERRRIVMQSRMDHENVVIEVADNGMGLSAEYADKVFEPFFTTKDTGMGIGLSISRQIIREHGGDIVALTNEHGGATFRVHLPIHHSSPIETTAVI